MSTAQLDYLVKRELYKRVKTDNTTTVVSAPNEPLNSRDIIRGDRVWNQSDFLLSGPQNNTYVTAVTKSLFANVYPATGSPLFAQAWKDASGRENWISSEFHPEFVTSFFYAPPNTPASNITNMISISSFPYIFDYGSGILSFLSTVPTYLTNGTNVIYVSGYIYNGIIGVRTVADLNIEDLVVGSINSKNVNRQIDTKQSIFTNMLTLSTSNITSPQSLINFTGSTLSNIGRVITNSIQPLSGNTVQFTSNVQVSGNLEVNGNINVRGEFFVIDTTACNTNQFRVDNDGTGPALIVNQRGVNDVTQFCDDGIVVFGIRDGGQSMFGRFGVASSTLPPVSPSMVYIENPSTSNQPGLIVRQNNTTSNAMEITTNGGNTVVVDARGNIGIGTVRPMYPFAVHSTSGILLPSGDSTTRPSVTVPGLVRYNTELSSFEGFGPGGSWGSLGGVKDVASTTYITAEASPGAGDRTLRFFTNNALRMTIGSNGNVGIGVSTPASRFHVNGDVRVLADPGTTWLNAVDGAGSSFVRFERPSGSSNTVITTINHTLASGPSLVVNTNRMGVFESTPTERFHVSGSTYVSEQYKGSINDTVTLPAFSWSNDQTTGIYHPTGCNIGFVTQSAERIRITQTGNVGIGSTTPQERLHVQGNVFASGQHLGSVTDSASAPAFSWSNDTDTGMFHVADNTIAFSTSGVQQMTVDSVGNVGIGTGTPTSRLDVRNGGVRLDANTSEWMTVADATTTYTRFQRLSGTNNTSIFSSNSLILDSSRGVGIGTNTVLAGTQLHVNGIVQVNNYVRTPNSDDGKRFVISEIGANAYAGIGKTPAAITYSTVSNTDSHRFTSWSGQVENELMRIQGLGNVGINTTSPVARLHVVGSSFVSGQHLGNINNSVSSPSFSWLNDTTTGMYRPRANNIAFVTGGVQHVTINSNGNVGIGMDSPSTKLHVSGDVRVTNILRFPNSNAGRRVVLWEESSTSGYTGIGKDVNTMTYSVFNTSESHRFMASNTELMRINGTPDSVRLQVIGNATVGTQTNYLAYTASGSGVLLPVSDGRLNGVNITTLNSRTRASYGTALRCVTQWSAGTIASSANKWDSICWSSELGVFVAVASLNLTNNVAVSSDGFTWRYATISYNIQSVCWSPKLAIFLAVGVDSTTGCPVFATSTNGNQWQTITVSSSRVNEYQANLHQVIWSPEGEIFVAVGTSTVSGETVYTSVNATSWTKYNAISGVNALSSVVWAPELQLFLCTSKQPSVSTSTVCTSTNGTTWTTQTTIATGDATVTCWSSELGLFVAAYTSIYTSRDATQWTLVSKPAQVAFIHSLCWSPDVSMFVGIGTSADYVTSYIISSPDGSTWNVVNTINNTNTLYSSGAICWSQELSVFLIVNHSSTLYRSEPALPSSLNTIRAPSSQLSVISASGNVGIGITNPNAKLDIRNGGMRLDSSVTNWLTVADANNTVFAQFQTLNSNLVVNTYNPSDPVNGGVFTIRAKSVGVATTNPVDRLHVVGSVYTTDQFKGAQTDSATSPAFSWSNDTITGIYHPDNCNVAITTGGVERARVTETGNLGIGTTSPTFALHVAGVAHASEQFLAQSNDVASTPGYSWASDTTTGIYHPSACNVAITTQGSERVRITEIGNVGIGTTVPDFLLHVAGAAHASTQFLAQVNDSASTPGFSWATDTTTGIYRPVSCNIAITTQGVERMRIIATGNVGIGTITPSQRLHVAGNALVGTRFVNQSYSNTLVPVSDGRINGINMSALNKRTRATYATTSTALNSWYTRSAGTVSHNYTSVCWAAELGLFVAVSQDTTNSRVITSSDGISWVSRTCPSSTWRWVCWSPELSTFVAVSSANTAPFVMTSSDGITWTEQSITSVSGTQWQAVCWAAELRMFVAVSGSGTQRVMTSTNGTAWTGRTAAASNAWRSICWSPELGVFVAASDTGTLNRIMTSTNGINWTTQNSVFNDVFRDVCWSPELGMFVVVNLTTNTTRALASYDSVNWFAVTIPSGYTWRSICWSPELSTFVACAISGTGSNRVITSSDGINWVNRLVNGTLTGNDWQSICWSPELSMFVGVGTVNTNILVSKPALPNSMNTILSPATQLTIDDVSGNIGIGSTTPNAKLDVRGNLRLLSENDEWLTVVDSTNTSYTCFERIGSNTIISTINNTNANGGSLILNATRVGIGETTPIERLHVSGNTYVTSQYRGPTNDTVSLPAFTWSNDVITGMYHPSTCNIGIVTGGVERLRVTQQGNVGIGVTTPQERLHVQGSVLIGTQFAYQSYSNTLVPVADGRVNGINIGALNKRTRATYGSTLNCVKTWYTRNIFSQTWSSICWSGELGMFVVVCNGAVGYSFDGITWTTITPNALNWRSVVWSSERGMFVALSSSSGTNRIMTSQNGVTWQTQTTPAGIDINWSSIVWAAEVELFVAVAENQTNDKVLISSNGTTWTTSTALSGTNWRSICWSPELKLLLAVGPDNTMTSSDGVTWAIGNGSASGIDWNAVCWSPELGLFVAVGNQQTAGNIMTSRDGINWIRQTKSNTNSLGSVCWSPELSVFVACCLTGTSNRILTSVDGTNWISQTSAADNNWRGICWAPELSMFACVGSGNIVMTSEHGIPNSLNTPLAPSTQFAIATQTGNIGIGITTPIAKLDVRSGGVRLDANTQDWLTVADANNTVFTQLQNVASNTVLSTHAPQSASGGFLVFNTRRVGVATTTPVERLHVSGSVYVTEQFKAPVADTVTIPGYSWSNDVTTGIYHPLMSNVGVVTAGTERMRINQQGNIGVGTTTPNVRLDIVGQTRVTSAPGIMLQLAPQTANGEASIGIYANSSLSGTPWTIGHNAFGVGATNLSIGYTSSLLTLTSSGRVGINSTAPEVPLHVNGSAIIGSNTGGRLIIVGSNVLSTLEFENVSASQFAGFWGQGINRDNYVWYASRARADWSMNYMSAVRSGSNVTSLQLTPTTTVAIGAASTPTLLDVYGILNARSNIVAPVVSLSALTTENVANNINVSAKNLSNVNVLSLQTITSPTNVVHVSGATLSNLHLQNVTTLRGVNNVLNIAANTLSNVQSISTSQLTNATKTIDVTNRNLSNIDTLFVSQITSDAPSINMSAKTLSNISILSTSALRSDTNTINVSNNTLSNVQTLSVARITSDTGVINVSANTLSNVATLSVASLTTPGQNIDVSTKSLSNISDIKADRLYVAQVDTPSYASGKINFNNRTLSNVNIIVNSIGFENQSTTFDTIVVNTINTSASAITVNAPLKVATLSTDQITSDRSFIDFTSRSFCNVDTLSVRALTTTDVSGRINASSTGMSLQTLYTNDIRPLTGQDISLGNNNLTAVNNLTIAGDLRVRGEFFVTNTSTCNTNQITIENDSTGPALIVKQIGVTDVAQFMDDDNIMCIMRNGGQTAFGSFGSTLNASSFPTSRLYVQNPVGDARSVLYVQQSNVSQNVIEAYAANGSGFVMNNVGNIGIGSGTFSPTHKLDVDGSIRVRSNILASPDSATQPSFTWFNDCNVGMFRPQQSVLGFTVGGTERVRVSTSLLTASVPITTTGAFQARSDDTAASPGYSWVGKPTTGIYSPAANAIAFTTSGTPRVIITGSRFGVGTTTPSESMDVQGGNVFVSGQYYANSNATATAPGYSWSNDTNTGMFRPAPDTIALATNGIQQMTVNSTGNVGIGTNAPVHKLHIENGNAYIAGQYLANFNASATAPGYSFSNDINMGMFRLATDTLAFATNGVSQMVVNPSGNVGIGTTLPAQKLDVQGNLVVLGQYYGNTADTSNAPGYSWSGDTDTGMFHPSASTIAFSTNALQRVIINSDGNVGVGTGTATQRLDIQGNAQASGQFYVNGGALASAPGYSFTGDTDTGMFRPAVNTVAFATNGTQQVLINQDGNVGIGTTVSGHKLHVQGNTFTSGQYYASAADSVASPGYSWSNDTNTGMLHPAADTIAFATNGTQQVTINTNGNVGIGTATPSFKLHAANGSVFIGDMSLASTTIPSSSSSATTANGHRLVFDNSFNNTQGTGVAANKIVLHNNNWLAGFGIETNGVAYHSGGHHRFYVNTTNASSYGTHAFTILSTGNVGIGATAPRQRLDIQGNAYASGQFYANINDSSASPGYSWSNDTATGMFHPLQNTIAFTTNATQHVTINPSGNLGIGTTAPAHRLDVSGTARITTSVTTSTIDVATLTTSAPTSTIDVSNKSLSNIDTVSANTVNATALLSTPVITSPSANVSFNNKNVIDVDSLIVRSNITVQISGPNAFTNLPTDLVRLDPVTGRILDQYISDAVVRLMTGSNTINPNVLPAIETNRNTLMHTTDRVGIGLRNPQQKLHVHGNQCITSGRLAIGTITPSSVLHIVDNNGPSPTVHIEQQGTTDILRIFGSNSSPIMHINANNNVGIQRTNPAYALDVNGTVYATTLRTTTLTTDSGTLACSSTNLQDVGNIRTTPSGILATNTLTCHQDNATTTVAVQAALSVTGFNTALYTSPTNTYGTTATPTRIGIKVDNNVLAQAFLSTSDRRIKTSINDIESGTGLDVVNSIPVRTYHVLPNTTDVITGFVAQEVEQYVPHAVHTTTNAIPDVHRIPTRISNDRKTLEITNHTLVVGDRIKIIYGPHGTDFVTTVTVSTASTVTLQDALPLDVHAEDVLIYGRIVDDFKLIDTDKLMPFAYDAIKQLHALVLQQQNEMTTLKSRMQILENVVFSLKK